MLAFFALLVAAVPIAAQAPPPTYVHKLADFSGELSCDPVPMHFDEAHNEVYVAMTDTVRIFNAAGMEVFQFFNDRKIGAILDLTVDPDGWIWALSNKPSRPHRPGGPVVARFDYRGRPGGVIVPRGIPEAEDEFIASFLEWRDGGLLWVDAWRKLAVQTDLQGRVEQTWDLAGAVASVRTDEERAPSPGSEGEITGFSLDREGRFLFTVAVLFRAFRMDPATGEVTVFGRGGSGPGKFGLVAGIVEDEFRQIHVADRARSVVLVFDRNHRFIREFGRRGPAATQLTYPQELAYGNGRLYVSQWYQRGVSVFTVGRPAP